jgi:NAD-dependent deacetylase
MKNIVILTGAGISAESGVATFRGVDGLWEGHRIEEVASPQGFRMDPYLVHEFYNRRRAQLLTVKPNPAHTALARLQREWQHGKVLLVTQNVDDLHERAGSQNVIHMHGELLRVKCTKCDGAMDWQDDLFVTSRCLKCAKSGGLRPDIVWFGEVPYFMETIYPALEHADLFVAIGTSGKVYPAAGFVSEAKRHGAHCLEMNLDPSDVSQVFHEQRIGPASEVVTAWVESLLATPES